MQSFPASLQLLLILVGVVLLIALARVLMVTRQASGLTKHSPAATPRQPAKMEARKDAPLGCLSRAAERLDAARLEGDELTGFQQAYYRAASDLLPKQVQQVSEVLKSVLWRQNRYRYSWGREAMQGSKALVPWLDIFSPSGFVRESALRNISGAAPNAVLLAGLIMRLNDWVPQVRAAAAEVLGSIIDASDDAVIGPAIAVLYPRVSGWGRMSEDEHVRLTSIIRSERIHNLLLVELVSARVGPMPSLFKSLTALPELDQHLENLSRNAIMPRVRAIAYEVLISKKAVWLDGYEWVWSDQYKQTKQRIVVLAERPISCEVDSLAVIRAGAADRSALVRKAVVQAMISSRQRSAEALDIARKLTLDANPIVAERATWLLAHNEGNSSQD